MYQALCYQTLDNNRIRCNLCRHGCVIPENARGICGVRENRGGKLYPLSAGLLVAENVDPIEKKPLYHLLPGSLSHSVASVGCNFTCLHCQNATIAQFDLTTTGHRIPGIAVPPEETVQRAISSGCRSIAYTYTEPTVWFEYALETARIATQQGLYNLFVSNAYISSEALAMITPFLHAANLDLKGFKPDFYRRVCGAELDKVLDGIREYRRRGIWLEITTLLIPGENDDDAQLADMARFIAEELGPETPWHISRFHPCHRMSDYPPTPVASMQRALAAGDKAGLRHIYEGNVPQGRSNTSCPSCGAVVIARDGYRITRTNLKDGDCGSCGRQIAGIWG